MFVVVVVVDGDDVCFISLSLLNFIICIGVQLSSVQSLSHVQLFETP